MKRVAILLFVLVFPLTSRAQSETPPKNSEKQSNVAASQPAINAARSSEATEEKAKDAASNEIPKHEADSALAPPEFIEKGEISDHQLTSVVEQDLDTKMELYRRGDISLNMGGMIQIQGAFYVGDGAALEFEDPADTEGFRVRRARFGFGGRLLQYVSYYLAVDLKDTVTAAMGRSYGNEILDASVSWDRFSFAQISVGVDKVPFSAFSMMSSSRLIMIERPLTAEMLSPSRRVGITVSGELGNLMYAFGGYNGSEGVTSGNRLAGLAVGGHVLYNILGQPARFVPREFRLGIGGSYMYDNGAAVNLHRAGGSLDVQGWRLHLLTEFLWERSIPDAVPFGAPDAGEVTRWGVIGQASAFLWRSYVQVAFRYEYFRDNEQLPTFGQQQLISSGLNIYLCRQRLKLQVNYIRRDEKEGPEVPNDIGLAQLQAVF
ncbi:MAG: porin [Pseudomonadota bacterium]